MDASEIGVAMAFPPALLEGLEVLAAEFEVMDAAASAAGDDAELAVGALAVLRPASAPADQGCAAPDEQADEPGASAMEAAVAHARRSGVSGPRVMRRPGLATRTSERANEVELSRTADMVPDPVTARTGASAAPLAHAGGDAAPDLVLLATRDEGGGFGPVVVPDEPAAADTWRPGSKKRQGLKERGGSPRQAGRSALTASIAYARGVDGRLSDDGSDGPFDAMGSDASATAARPAAHPAARWEAGTGAPARGGGTVAGWDERSVAPPAAGIAGGARGAGSHGGLFEQPAVAPQAESGGERDGGPGIVMLDGRLVGQWLTDRMARDAGRPGAGTTFFDPRQAPAWTPSGVL